MPYHWKDTNTQIQRQIFFFFLIQKQRCKKAVSCQNHTRSKSIQAAVLLGIKQNYI